MDDWVEDSEEEEGSGDSDGEKKKKKEEEDEFTVKKKPKKGEPPKKKKKKGEDSEDEDQSEVWIPMMSRILISCQKMGIWKKKKHITQDRFWSGKHNSEVKIDLKRANLQI